MKRRAWLLLGVSLTAAAADDWAPAAQAALSPWGEEIEPDSVWSEYPRPALCRPAIGKEKWLNLNGLWQFSRSDGEAEDEPEWGLEQLLPFAPGAPLSGVRSALGPGERASYRRCFEIPEEWLEQRLILRVAAAADGLEVEFNGAGISGGARGFDLSEHVRAEGEQELVLRVRGNRPPEEVWLEPVPGAHLVDVRTTPDIDRGLVEVDVDAVLDGTVNLSVQLVDPEGRPRGAASLGLSYEGAAAGINHRVATGVKVPLPNAELWTPRSPKLHRFRVELRRDGAVIDSVEGRFGMRKIAVGAGDGAALLMLNNAPQLQIGPLYRGRWPDGGSMPPGIEALRHDLKLARDLGFNMIRVAGEAGSARLYHECDRLGLMIWQDLSGGREQMRETVDLFGRHASIAGWRVDGDEAAVSWLRRHDPSRPVIGPGGDLKVAEALPAPTDRRPGRADALQRVGADREALDTLDLRREARISAVFLGPLTDDPTGEPGLQSFDRRELHVDGKALRERLDLLLGERKD